MTAAALPGARWQLTAPETYLLRYVDCRPRPTEAFTLALKELVTRGALCLRSARIPGRLGIGTRRVWLLTAGPAFTAVTEPALTPILDLYERVRRRSGVDSHDPSIAVDGVLLDASGGAAPATASGATSAAMSPERCAGAASSRTIAGEPPTGVARTRT
jgi:hypothetical protein